MLENKDYGFSTEEYCYIHKYLLDLILLNLHKNKNKKILDIGCGNGWLTYLLIERASDVYGTDASKSGIAIAKRKTKIGFSYKIFLKMIYQLNFKI